MVSVDDDIRAVEQALRPGGREAAAAVLRLLRRNVSWRVPEMNHEAVALYLDAISDIPVDLLDMAGRRAVRDLEFWPSPAKLRSCVAGELSERRSVLARLRHAEWKLGKKQAEDARRDRGVARSVPALRVRRLADVPRTPEEALIEVTPEEAAARVSEWNRALK